MLCGDATCLALAKAAATIEASLTPTAAYMALPGEVVPAFREVTELAQRAPIWPRAKMVSPFRLRFQGKRRSKAT